MTTMTTIHIIAVIYLLGLFFNSFTLFEETCDCAPFKEEHKSVNSFSISVLKWMFWPITFVYKKIKTTK